MTSSRSLRALGLVFIAALSTTLAGCWVEPDPQHTIEPGTVPVDDPPVTTPVRPSSVSIVTGQTLSADGGKGIGVYAEYAGQGQWHLWTTCDTLISNNSCRFRLHGTPETGASLSNVQASDSSNAGDSLGTPSRDRFDVFFDTSYEADGVVLQVDPPGAAITLEASLDDVDNADMVFWVGPTADGKVRIQAGAPSNPVTFVPSAD